jgi:hypothetical protein
VRPPPEYQWGKRDIPEVFILGSKKLDSFLAPHILENIAITFLERGMRDETLAQYFIYGKWMAGAIKKMLI